MMAKCCIKIPLETLGGIYGFSLFYLTGISLVKQFSFLSFSLSFASFLPFFLSSFSLSFFPSSLHSFLPPFLPFIHPSFLPLISLSLSPSLSLPPLQEPPFLSFPPPLPSSPLLFKKISPISLLGHRISACHLYHWKGKYYQVSVNVCSSTLCLVSGSLGGDHS